MAFLFRRRCPIDLDSRVDVEMRFRRWASLLGSRDVLQQQTLLPEHSDLVVSNRGDEEDIQRILATIVTHLEVPAERYSIHEAETDQEGAIVVHESSRNSSIVIAGSIAFQVVRDVMFSKHGRLPKESYDDGDVEVLTALLGLGLLRGQRGLSQPGLQRLKLTSDRLAYVLALRAWIRDEPAQAGSLSLDVSQPFRAARRYLQRRDAGLFNKTSLFDQAATPPLSSIRDDLRSKRPEKQLAAARYLNQIQRDNSRTVETPQEIDSLLSHSNKLLRREAATAMSYCAAPRPESLGALVRLLQDPESDVVVAAVIAVTQQHLPLSAPLSFADNATLADEIRVLLTSSASHVFDSTATMLTTYGEEARDFVPAIVKQLVNRLIACHYEDAEFLIEVLLVMKVDVEDALHAELAQRDPDLLAQTLNAVKHFQASRAHDPKDAAEAI